MNIVTGDQVADYVGGGGGVEIIDVFGSAVLLVLLQHILFAPKTTFSLQLNRLDPRRGLKPAMHYALARIVQNIALAFGVIALLQWREFLWFVIACTVGKVFYDIAEYIVPIVEEAYAPVATEDE